ncbi:hypothetical protein V8G54_010809 [Vigna mungo]|uniref:BHLH domain-containing protein n=1 Tax=Vigna mungo TaxID=3915 RepID=A0AAQ3NZW4_VIGMU
MAEDNSTDDSHINEDNFLTGIVLEPLDFSFHNSSTTTMLSYDKNSNSTNNVFSMGSSYENASFDERHGKMLKSNSSSSIISHDVANNNASSSSSAPSSSTFILSFENSTMEPSHHHHHRPNNDHGSCPRDALCSSLLSSENDHFSTPKAKQGAKKYRSSSQIQDHIMAERKRRQELTERFIALSATIPGLKKTDKAHILREAMIYMKELEERVIELENQNKRKRSAESRILIKKYSQREEERKCDRSSPPLPQVEARVLEKEVLIGIHCHKQKDIMDEQYCMTVNNLVKSLRQALLKIT